MIYLLIADAIASSRGESVGQFPHANLNKSSFFQLSSIIYDILVHIEKNVALEEMTAVVHGEISQQTRDIPP